MKASDVFVGQLEKEGVQYIFGVPGEENLDLLESIRTSKQIKLVLTRHEQAAGFMAATHGRLTGHAGVALATLGPGATNLVTAAAYAQLGAMPMMMITGQKPIRSSKQGQFQIVDVVEMMQPITKYSHQLVSAEDITSRVREAFREAEEERPGAVHLELPEDIAAEDVSETYFVDPLRPRRPVAEEKAIAKAVELIEGAKSPLLLIGAGANRKMVANMLKQLIDKTGMYCFSTQMGKGVVDERDPHCLGTAALSDNDYIHCAIAKADLIINVGHDVVEKPPFFMHGDEKTVIHVNFNAAVVDPIYHPQHVVVGDIANAVWQISEKITPNAKWDFSYFKRMETEIEKHVSQNCSNAAFPIYPQRLVSDVRKVMPEEGILSLDNGMYKIWFARNYKAYLPNTILLDNALATMGAGLPSAIAAKLIYPDKKVVAICGDGGFMMNSQEMETAVRLNLDLVIIILKDDGYGMIKWKQEGMKLPSFGLDYGNPDFVKYAESYGATGHRVEDAEGFADTLKKAITAKGVHVLEVPIDYRENNRVLTDELSQKTCLL